ncbi:hypothetical protein ACJRO7_001970 [Eucalyptus globulus]|uniref:F-box domain-containing protein n=1 Tax=Eucalyptus globulus TaxID=34317 RepID=A0ABD3LWJ3_EUCGL
MPASMDSPSPKRLRSKNEDESADKDRISCLPDDVVGSILSLLRSREAQATCLLSRRWRHLSTCQVTNLDFDWSNLLDEMKGNPELAEKERARYVAWVDNSHIDRWIRFALTKRVKILKLDFEPTCEKDLRRDCDPSRLPYPLGHEILMDVDIGCSRRAPGQSNFGWNSSSSWHVGFKYLEELGRITKKVLNLLQSVEEELIEQLLVNCPVLERLVLEHSPTLNRLRVSGQSLKLKYLCIAYCKDLDRVEIYDTGLVSFTFMGCEIPLCLDKLPQLSEVFIRKSHSVLVHKTLS